MARFLDFASKTTMSEVEISSELLDSLDRLSEPDTKSADAEQGQSNLDGILRRRRTGEAVHRRRGGCVGRSFTTNATSPC